MTTQDVYHLTGTTGEHYYLLPSNRHRATDYIADGQPMKMIREGRRDYSGHDFDWYSTPHKATTIEMRPRDTRTTVIIGYTLKDPEAESARYPLNLTVMDWNERTDDGDDDEAPENSLYRAEVQTTIESGEATPVNLDSVIDLDGDPPPDDGHVWHAHLPRCLEGHHEVLHLFPGELRGFREAVRLAVRKRLGVGPGLGETLAPAGCIETSERPPRLRAWREVPYSPRQTEFRHDTSRSTGRRLKSGRVIQKLAKLNVVVSVDDVVSGSNRAEAMARWNTMLPELVEEIVSEIEPAVCWHCGGTGIVRSTCAHKETS